MDKVAQLISEFGFPVVLALGMGYFIYFVWKFVTLELKPQLSKSSSELIRLLDQIRMLDNDLIRLQQKVDTVLEYKETQEKVALEVKKKKSYKTLYSMSYIATYIFQYLVKMGEFLIGTHLSVI